MPATYKAVIRADKPPKQNGRHTVLVRLTAARKQLYVDTGLDVRARDWNESGSIQKPNWVRAAEPQAELYNHTIQKFLLRAQAVALAHPTLSAADFRDRLTGKVSEAGGEAGEGSADFLAYFEADVAQRLQHGNPRTAERYLNRLTKLKRWRGWVPATQDQPEVPAQPLPMRELTPKLLRDYKQHLEQLGNRGQTVPKELSALNTIVKLAVADGLLRYEQNPFLHLKLTVPDARKDYLRPAELARLQNLELAPEKLSGKWHVIAQAAWLLGFYLYGSRIGDVLMLRRRHVQADCIQWIEQKTGKQKEVALYPELRALLLRFTEGSSPDAFILPVLDERQWYFRYPQELTFDDLEKQPAYRLHLIAIYNAIESGTTQLNKYIKKVAVLAGIERHMTMHMARHSFITLSIKGGYDLRKLQGLANHHSLSETERYAHDLEKSESWAAGVASYDGIRRLLPDASAPQPYADHTPPTQPSGNSVSEAAENPKIRLHDTG